MANILVEYDFTKEDMAIKVLEMRKERGGKFVMENAFFSTRRLRQQRPKNDDSWIVIEEVLDGPCYGNVFSSVLGAYYLSYLDGRGVEGHIKVPEPKHYVIVLANQWDEMP